MVLLFFGCPDPRASLHLPELPDLEALDEPVRRQFEQRHAAVQRLMAAQQRDATELARAFGNLAMVYHAYRDLGIARICYKSARELDPEAFRWAYLLAVVERDLGDFAASDAIFEEALSLRENDLPSLIWRAENALDEHRIEEAGMRFQMAYEIRPEEARAHFGLARVALERGDFQDALKHLETAQGAQPSATPVLYSMGLVYRSLGDLERSQEYMDRIPKDHLKRIDLTLTDPLAREVRELERGAMVHEHRGLKAAAQGRFGVAASELGEAVALDEDRHETRHNLALALLRLGRRAEARKELDEVLTREPSFAPSHLVVANLLREDGLLQEAELHLLAAIEADPQSAKPHLALAELLDAMGLDERAKESHARAAELDPLLVEERSLHQDSRH